MSITKKDRPRPLKRGTDSYLIQTKRLFKTSRTIEDSQNMIKFLRQKEELSLANNQLSQLRNDVWTYLGNLKILNLSDNFLHSLPNVLSILIHLEDLNLSKNKLVAIPAVVFSLKSLKKLSLDENSLTDLSGLEILTNLEEVNASSNILTKLPDSFTSLSRLKRLDISCNHFKSIPLCIQQGLGDLEYLNVSANIRLSLSARVKSHKLKWLIAKDIPFCPAFPKWVLSGQYSVFEEFDISRTKFEKFIVPMTKQKTMIRKLSLQTCSLINYKLQNLLANVIGLRTLRIGNDDSRANLKMFNEFSHWPLGPVSNPGQLVKLEMRNLHLPVLPPSVGKFRNLREIDLTGNDVHWLPREIGELKKLETMVLDGNFLGSLPEEIGEMRMLRELRAAGNNLESLPLTFGMLKALEFLDLYNNRFEEIPKVLEQCPALRAMDFESNYVNTEGAVVNKILCETLKENCRDKLETFRYNGPKQGTPESSPNSRCSYYESPSPINVSNDFTTSSALENWDESQDSSDEFDPNNPTPPRAKTSFIYTGYKHAGYSNNITYVNYPAITGSILLPGAQNVYQPPVEGQFDDAEETDD